MVNKIYETIRTSRGIDYRYWGIGKFSVYIGPKDAPEITNEENILKLLQVLDRNEISDLKLYAIERDKLTKSLSEAKKKEYEKLRKQELQTRLRQFQKLSSYEIIEYYGSLTTDTPRLKSGESSSKK